MMDINIDSFFGGREVMELHPHIFFKMKRRLLSGSMNSKRHVRVNYSRSFSIIWMHSIDLKRASIRVSRTKKFLFWLPLMPVQINPTCKSGIIPMIGMSSELLDQSYLQFGSLQHDMFMDSSDLLLRPNVNPPAAVSDTSLGSCLNVTPPFTTFTAFRYVEISPSTLTILLRTFQVNGSSVWNTNLQNVYGVEFQLGRGTALPFQSLQGKDSHPLRRTSWCIGWHQEKCFW